MRLSLVLNSQTIALFIIRSLYGKKMDYGAAYADIRNNYAKSGKKTRAKKARAKKVSGTEERGRCRDPHGTCSGKCGGASCAEIKYFLDRCSEFTMANCSETLDFCDRLYSRQWDRSNVKRGRALTTVLCISNRIKEICEADKGKPLAAKVTSQMEELIHVVCTQWTTTKEMKHTILEMHPLLKGVVADALCCSLDNLASFDDEAWHTALYNCGK
jgi:hypothetical protein